MGERPGFWTPKTTGAGFEFTPILKPLEPFRDSLVVVSNLDRPPGGTHAVSTATWLTGSAPKRTEAEDFLAGISLDQVIAAADRRRHGAAVARGGDRGPGRLHRRLRRGLQLRLHEHHRVEGAHHAAADADQPAGDLRAAVRPARVDRRPRGAHARRPEHPRLGDAGRRVARARPRRARSRAGSASIWITFARSSSGSPAPRSRRRPT